MIEPHGTTPIDRHSLRTALSAGLGNVFASSSGLEFSQDVAQAVLSVSTGTYGAALALGRQRLLGGLLKLQVGYTVGGVIIVMGWLVHEAGLAAWIPIRFLRTSFGSPVLKTESLADLTACVLITIVGQLNLAILIVGLWASRGNGANRSTLLTPQRLNTPGAQERCTHLDEAPQAMISISMAVRNRALALLWLGLIPTPMIQAALAAPQMTAPAAQRRPAQNQGTEQLERSWQRLEAELRTLDRLLPGEPEPPVRGVLSTPELPAGSGVENAGVVGAEQHDLALHLGGHGPAQGPHHQQPADSHQAQSCLAVIAQAGPSLQERRG